MANTEIAAIIDDAEQWEPLDLRLSRLPHNDLGNAERLIARCGEDLIWVEQLGWLVWDGRCWVAEGGKPECTKRAHAVVKALRREAAAIAASGPRTGDDGNPIESPRQANARIEAAQKFASVAGNVGRIEAMMATAAPYLRRRAAELDAAAFLLNARNGTLLLPEDAAPAAAGGDGGGDVELRPHDRRDLLTHVVAADYDPEAECPVWRGILTDILPDLDIRNFLQRWCGYCLTGDISEQAIVIFYGTGKNGKSTILAALKYILADYCATVPISTFLYDEHRSGGDATPDLARLPGVRLVLASEPEAGDRMSESTIKFITGGETVVARKLFHDQFEYDPTFKVIISCNQKPQVRGQDEGIWRRLMMVPFTVTIPEAKRVPMPRLMARLKGEAPGILNWCLDGYRMWRETGLVVPDAVRRATEAYRTESDPVGEFLACCTRPNPKSSIVATRLYAAYRHWSGHAAKDPVTANLFGRRMTDRGYQREKYGSHYWVGIELILETLPGFEDPYTARED